MMQDRKALQAGTSHFLGQNFAKAQDIKFQSESGGLEHAWTTSWGVSTRLVGGLIMTHADDDGLVLPPKLAPAHAVILPIYRSDEERAAVVPYCESLSAELQTQRYDDEPIRVRIDDRDLRGGEKKWQWVKRGVPLRLEVGPRDVAGGGVFVSRRDTGGKGRGVDRAELVAGVAATLDEVQRALLDRAVAARDQASTVVDSMADFEALFAEDAPGGLAYAHFTDGPEMEARCKELRVTPRCVPLEPVHAGDDEPGECLFTGRPSRRRAVFARAY